MREFNTSGPCIPKEHYTLMRPNLIQKGIQLVEKKRYFTIWAPRQTGKSTYFRLLADSLKTKDYKIIHINVEDSLNLSEERLLYILENELKKVGISIPQMKSISDFSVFLKEINDYKLVLIIDEIEGLNPELFNQFLHSIRNLYHFRHEHTLKSVILVGVTNIVGIVEDNASPFNIADNLPVPYFTDEETFELLGQHETETGQLFEEKVKSKISEITANQPGLVNGFAYKLVENNPDKKMIDYEDYLEVEDWYVNKGIDKNISNILNKAGMHRRFVESLLFTDIDIPFKINRPAIKSLHTNGVIKSDDKGNVTFWVPLYKKCLYDAFYPYTNGEGEEIQIKIPLHELTTKEKYLDIYKFIEYYKKYVKRRSFRHFREKDKNGQFKSIKEAAMMYSFETYIQAILQMLGGTSYREADTGLGKSDLIININGKEQLIESKKYYHPKQFLDGRDKLVHYCKSLGLNEATYLVFVRNDAYKAPVLIESTQTIKGIIIHTFIVEYDEEKDF